MLKTILSLYTWPIRLVAALALDAALGAEEPFDGYASTTQPATPCPAPRCAGRACISGARPCGRCRPILESDYVLAESAGKYMNDVLCSDCPSPLACLRTAGCVEATAGA